MTKKKAKDRRQADKLNRHLERPNKKRATKLSPSITRWSYLAPRRREIPDGIPSSACCQVNRVTERFGSDKNSCRPLLAKTAALHYGSQGPGGVKPARLFDAKSVYAMKNLKRNICSTFKEVLLLYVPSVISQIRSSGVFLGSMATSVLVKLKLKLHKSSILAPFFSDGSNGNVSREEPECHNYLLRIVSANVFIFMSQCSTRLTHQMKSRGTLLNVLFWGVPSSDFSQNLYKRSALRHHHIWRWWRLWSEH